MNAEIGYRVGTIIRIAPLERLEEFRRVWRLHNPLEDSQLAFAGMLDSVTWVGTYHGGDRLYTLKTAPGVWHEQLLDKPN